MAEFRQDVITPLNSTNYATWAADAKVLLMDRNAWDIVQGKETKPDATTVSSKEVKDFNLRYNRAYTTIYLSISPEYRTLIEDISDGKEAWERLQKHFKPESRARLVQLLDQFFSCRMDINESVGLFGARLKKIVNEMKDAKHPIEDIYQSFQLIRFLPVEFEAAVQAIYRWSDENFKFDKVLEELNAEESRLNQRAADQDGVAMMSRKKSLVCKKPPKFKERNLKCSGTEESVKYRKARNRSRGPPDKGSYGRNFFVVEANSGEGVRNDTTWVFDSAASAHFCHNKNLFTEFTPLRGSDMAVAIEGVTCPIEGKGKICLRFGEKEITLHDVLYVSKLKRNLLAGSKFESKGATFVGKNGKINIYSKQGDRLFSAWRRRGLYYCFPFYRNLKTKVTRMRPKNSKRVSNVEPQAQALDSERRKNFDRKEVKRGKSPNRNSNDLYTWHRRCSHINKDYLIRTSKANCVRGLPLFKDSELNCESCKIAKGRRCSFKPIGKIISKNPLDLLHMDLCGPMPTKSMFGQRYFLSIIDDYSRKVTTFPLKDKSEAFSAFERFQKRAERFLDRKVKRVRTDNGLEFVNNKFRDLFEKLGIEHQLTNVYTPEQNGIAERYNYTAVDGIKTLLEESGLDKSFWAEALMHFTYSWNRIVHKGQDATPFELYSGYQPSVNHLKPFGTKVYVNIPKQLRRKLDARSKQGIMVGYAHHTKGYRIYVPSERKIVETINVKFNEEIHCPPRGRFQNESNTYRRNTYLFRPEPESESDNESEEETLSKGKGDDSEEGKVMAEKADIQNEPGNSKDESEEEDFGRTSPYDGPAANTRSKTAKQESLPLISSTAATTEDDDVVATENDIIWIREVKTIPNTSRVEIWYRIQGRNDVRLNSREEVRKYFKVNNLHYDPREFDFKSTNLYRGIVKPPRRSSPRD